MAGDNLKANEIADPKAADKSQLGEILLAEAQSETPVKAEKIETRIENKALVLSMSDPQFDTKLAWAANNQAKEFDTLKITDVPTTVKVNYWQDPHGLFLWFKDGGDGNKKHYIPENVTYLELPHEKTTTEQLRIETNENYAKHTFNDLVDFNRSFNPSYDGGVSSLKYFAGMSGKGSEILDTQEKYLRDAVKDNSNPYFKIYLADVLTAKAIQPIINSALTSEAVKVDNPTTLSRVDEAISLLDAANRDSNGQLGAVGRYPQGNVYAPLMPGVPYWNSSLYPDQFYGFWAGSYDQSRMRHAALTLMRNHIVNNSFPQLQLPPALPPRKF
jgi:hypothetical protein